jgi:hypothetical protein
MTSVVQVVQGRQTQVVTLGNAYVTGYLAPFATRAAFVAWAATVSPTVGLVVHAAGFAYRYAGSGTAISDAPGWVIDNPVFFDSLSDLAASTTPLPVGTVATMRDVGGVTVSATGTSAPFSSALSAPLVPRVGANGVITAEQLGIAKNAVSDQTDKLQWAINNFALPAYYGIVVNKRAARPIRIELGDGVYPIAGLELKSGITLAGCGAGTVLLHSGASDSSIKMRSDAMFWGLEGLVIDGDGTNMTYTAAKSGIQINSDGGSNFAYGALIRDVHLQNIQGHAITHNNGGVSSDIMFENIRITRANGIGLDLTNVNDSKFSMMEIRQCALGTGAIVGKNLMFTNFKAWQSRCADYTVNIGTQFIPLVAAQSSDTSGLILSGANMVFNGLEMQEHACVAIQVGTTDRTMAGLIINGLILDGNGGWDIGASDAQNVIYQRDGILLVNHYNTQISGIADDFRQRQGRGRQKQAIKQVVTVPEYSSGSTLYTDNWYVITDNSGGADFTNIQLGLATPSNAVGTVFQAQKPYASGAPVPTSWGTGKLKPVNGGLCINMAVQNQQDQVRGTGLGYTLTGASATGSRFIVNGEDVTPMQSSTVTVQGLTTAGSATYTFQEIRYQRVGRRIEFEIILAWTGHTGTGSISIAGLPVAARKTSVNTVPLGLVHVYASSGLAFTGPELIAHAEDNILRLRQSSTAGTGTAVPITAAGTVFLSGSYETA